MRANLGQGGASKKGSPVSFHSFPKLLALTTFAALAAAPSFASTIECPGIGLKFTHTQVGKKGVVTPISLPNTMRFRWMSPNKNKAKYAAKYESKTDSYIYTFKHSDVAQASMDPDDLSERVSKVAIRFNVRDPRASTYLIEVGHCDLALGELICSKPLFGHRWQKWQGEVSCLIGN